MVMRDRQADFVIRRDAAQKKAHLSVEYERARERAMPAFILLAGVLLAVIAIAVSFAVALA